MATFKELISQYKTLLKENLNDSNLELITRLDKGLDELSESHNKTEEDLSSTKDKLIEVVKNTSFKDDSEPLDPTASTQDEAMDIDKALELAIKEQLDKR